MKNYALSQYLSRFDNLVFLDEEMIKNFSILINEIWQDGFQNGYDIGFTESWNEEDYGDQEIA